MAPLPKHLRPRWRYLAVTVESWPEATLTRRAFQGALWDRARSLFGDAGAATLDLQVVSFEHEAPTGQAVVRTRRGESDDARAVVATVDAVGEAPVGLRVAGVSGTVRACEEKYLGRRGEAPEHGTVAFDDAARPAAVREKRVDVDVDSAYVGATDHDLE